MRLTVFRTFVFAAALWVSAAPTPVRAQQDDPVKALSDEYAQLESEGLKENFHRRLSFTMLQPYLPPGARMTSGYRSPQKQLDLILRLARAKGIATPAVATIDDDKTWRPALLALRERGFIIAAPTTTPHATEEAVFDLSGAELGAIEEGCRRAEKAGMIKFRRIIRETQNNAVHVEIETISPKALNVLGQRRSAGAGTSSGGTGDAGAQNARMSQQLLDLHNSELDPAKKIDYDRSRKNLLDPTADAAAINNLDAEIERHRQEMQQLGGEVQKRAAIVRISEALRDGRLEEAERDADAYAATYLTPAEAERMLAQIRTRRLIREVNAALDEEDCDECENADVLIDEALLLSPEHAEANALREEIDDCLSRCRIRRLAVLGVVGLFVVGLGGAGAYFFLRLRKASSPAGVAAAAPGAARIKSSSKWYLEGIDGAGRGQIFPLDKGEMTIGSQGPPEGPADIIVCDDLRKISRRHCTVMQNGKQFYLMDQSTNGTKVNDREAPRGVLVEFRPGDRISLADVALLQLRSS